MNLRSVIAVGAVMLLASASAFAQTNIIPAMTADNAPSPYVASASAEIQGGTWSADAGMTIIGSAYRPFDQTNDEYGWVSVTLPSWLQINQGASPQAICSYAIENRADRSVDGPTAWTLLGSSTGAFVGEQTTIDARSGISWASVGQTQTFTLPGSETFQYLRINVTASNGGDFVIRRLQFLGCGGGGPPPPPPPPPAQFGVTQIGFPLASLPSYDCLAGTAPTIPANDVASVYFSNLAGNDFLHPQPALAAAGGRIIAVGDSIINSLAWSQVSPYAVSFGIGGNSTSGLLNMLGGLTALHSARAIVVHIGESDITYGQQQPGNSLYSEAGIEANLAAIFNWISSRPGGCGLVWMPILPNAATGINAAAFAQTAADINAWAANFLATKPNAAVANVSAFTTAMTVDGAHPNAQGAAIIQPGVQTAISQLQ